ncbi:hypothetical protein QJQ45_007191 [Haematococcus lacustris]|nr:hypothetical protein QJQ45_007191 [Haematococcus lacustris]
MNQAFATVIDRCALVYLDDILIMSKSIQEHLSHLREIFSLLREHKYFAKLSKCEFMKESLPFLGHIISKDGVAVDPSKVTAIKDWPVPTNLTALQSFLGMANYVLTSATAKTDTDKILVTTRQQKRRLQEGEDVGAGTPLSSGSGGSEQQPAAGSDLDHDADSDDALKPSEPKRLRWADPVSNDCEAQVPECPGHPSQVTDWLVSAYSTDPAFAEPNEEWEMTQEGLWRHLDKGTIIVPNDIQLREHISHEMHDAKYAGHVGITKTLERVRRVFWWKTMRADVRHYVTNCDACQRNKASRQVPGGLLNPLSIPGYRWESVTMDLVVKLPVGVHGYDSICVVVDRLSKMVHLIPCIEAMDAKEFAELYIDHVFKYHGLSKVTISDRGATFNNQFWIEVRKLIGVDPAFSTAYHPQSDGQTERTNQIVEEMLRHYILPTQEDWPRHLAFAEFAINNSWQESIQSTPFLVNYGQSPITPVLHKLPRPCLSPSAESFAKKWEHEVKHAQECMRVAQDRQQRYANKRRRDVTFNLGDSVLLSTKNLRNAPGKARKFLPRYVGPFKVTGKLGEAAYRLELPPTMSRLHPVFHVSLLKKYTGSQGFHPPPVMEWLEDAPHYEVHSLLSHRQVRFKKRMEYLVKWTGYDDTYNTWEPEAMLAGAPQILSRYKAVHNLP